MMPGESEERVPVEVTSSVMSVSRLDRSIEFYREVFSCTVSVREQGAALLLAPDGFQIYLIAHGTRAEHPTGGIGHQYLIWAVGTAAALRDVAAVLADRDAHPDLSASGGVSFVTARDPDGNRVVVAHPSPSEVPRAVIAGHLYT